MKYIVIRHLSGSNANLIEHVSVTGTKKITIGRDPKSNIAFDLSPGDIRHAVIRVVGDDQTPFRA